MAVTPQSDIFLDSDSFAEEFIAQYKKNLLEKKAFFESEEFMRIHTALKHLGHVSEEALTYEGMNYPGVNINEFYKYCECVLEMIPSTEEPGVFPYCHAEYKGVKVSLLTGLGTIFWTERID